MIELVTIERVDGRYRATIWDAQLEKLARASGSTPLAALINAEGVLARGSFV